MRLNRPHTLKEVAEMVDCKYLGPDDHSVTGINEIHMVKPGDIVFVDHPKYYEKALNSAATTILINKEVTPPEGKALIFADDPFSTFNALVSAFRKRQNWEISEAEIHPTAVVAPSAVLGKNVKIGARSVIHPNVVIYDNAEIGADVQIQIGAGCTIDKGVSGATEIGEGTKIDNSVHIGHDTVIGRDCLLAAQVGVAGCVVIEDGVTLWGQVGVRSDITIGAGAVVLAQTGISKALEGGKTYFGSPVGESREKLKELANTRKIPTILEDVKALQKKFEQ
ncbi:MAG: UDP-3-O-(3-hydroxymyristoyl)glucosamine N-acyltransferase [Flavobacteriales bacterium]|nr:UDP-3-O-(3-hydroxymyristoyl)glucosamine N-acyltransferase [Flavobacteriales bacterium]